MGGERERPKASTLVCRYALENRSLRERVEAMEQRDARVREGIAALLATARHLSAQVRALAAANERLGVAVAAERLRVQELLRRLAAGEPGEN